MDGQQHRENIGSALSGFFSSETTQGTATGGSFEFTEDDMRTLVTNWQDLAKSYDDSLRDAYHMTAVEGPGLDFASKWHATAANQSGESYMTYLRHNHDYCLQQAQQFQATLDTYLGIEHSNATEINKSGPQAGI